MKEIIKTNLAPEAIGTYSQGVKHGNVYYFSGQIGSTQRQWKWPVTLMDN